MRCPPRWRKPSPCAHPRQWLGGPPFSSTGAAVTALRNGSAAHALRHAIGRSLRSTSEALYRPRPRLRSAPAGASPLAGRLRAVATRRTGAGVAGGSCAAFAVTACPFAARCTPSAIGWTLVSLGTSGP